MSYGFKTAATLRLEFEVLGGLDIDEHANSTYRRMVGAPALSKDIRNLRNASELSTCLKQWGRDDNLPLVLIGCAPCQGFSSHRKKGQWRTKLERSSDALFRRLRRRG
jgi:DNA (cytosine-5)-methyltransferase 1